MRAGGFPGNPGGLVVSIVKTAGARAPAHQARGRGRRTWRPTERTAGARMVPPGEGNEARGDGRRGVGVSHSTAEAGELSPRDPVEGRGHRQVAPLEGKTANTPRLGPVSTSRQRIAELARQAVGMAVAIAWLPGPAGTRRRVAKLSVEEPDAAEPARPDLWGARVSNDPGLPDPVTTEQLGRAMLVTMKPTRGNSSPRWCSTLATIRIWKVARWLDPVQIQLDQDAVRAALRGSIAPWIATGMDGGLGRELAKTTVEVVGLNMDRGVLVETFPEQWRCKQLRQHSPHSCREVRVRRPIPCTDAVRDVSQLRCIGRTASPALPDPQCGCCSAPGHRDGEGTALLLPALSDRADAGWLPLPAVQLRQWRDAGDCTPCRGCLLATVRRARQPTRPGARSAPARSRGRCPGTVALRWRVASSLPACTRRRARGVLVFGGVGPPRRCVGHDRGPGRIGGPCVSRGAQAGGVRPLPPPATRRGRGAVRPYAVPRRTRRRCDAVRGAAGPAG